MNSLPLLSIALFLPLVGAFVVALMPKTGRSDLPKVVALGVSILTLVVVGVVAAGFDPGGDRFQFTETHVWIKVVGAHYALGVDGIGLTLLMLTVIIVPIVMIASWHDAEGGRWSERSFFAWTLALESAAVGAFSSTDVFLFYVMFEAILFPAYFLIGGFGGLRRSYAAVKFLIFSLTGGLLMLGSVVGLYVVSARSSTGPTYLLSELTQIQMGTDVGRWLFLGFFIAFAIKAPLVPLHTWLPDAAEEATPGTAVLMVSILDKIGTFGMIRYCLELFPEASRWASPVVIILAILSVLYGALAAIGQRSIPRLIAYTSVSHFGFIVLGIFVLNSQGQSGSTLYMFNHGMSTAALFLVAGFLIRRRGSDRISDYGGVEKVAPVLAGTFLVAGLSSLSLPGLSPFVSEFLVLLGAFSHAWWWGTAAIIGIVLAALYILLMYQRTMTGPTVPAVAGLRDLSVREIASLAPLLALIVVLGFFPKPLTAVVNPAVEATLTQIGAKDPAPAVPASATSRADRQEVSP